MVYLYTPLSSTDASSKYVVNKFDGAGKSFDRERELTYCNSSNLISCSCRLFEFDGYPCRHMLCWMKVQQIMMLSEKYINRRWTKKAKSLMVFEPIQDFVKGQSFSSRHVALSHLAMDLVDKCSLTDASSNFLMAELDKLKSKVNDFDFASNTSHQQIETTRHELAQNIQDPNLVRAKGCGKRLRSSKEKTMSHSSRSCSVCARSGHDKRTCPDLQNMYQ